MFTKILGAISALKFIVTGVIEIGSLIKEALRRAQDERRRKKLEEALKEAEKPGTLDETAMQACKIEKIFNPDSDCDAQPRKPKL